MNKNPFENLHKIADAGLDLVEDYQEGREFTGGLESLILHLMLLEKFLDTGRANLGDKNISLEENYESFKLLVSKMDSLRDLISEIGGGLETVDDSKVKSICSQYGNDICSWYSKLTQG